MSEIRVPILEFPQRMYVALAKGDGHLIHDSTENDGDEGEVCLLLPMSLEASVVPCSVVSTGEDRGPEAHRSGADIHMAGSAPNLGFVA